MEAFSWRVKSSGVRQSKRAGFGQSRRERVKRQNIWRIYIPHQNQCLPSCCDDRPQPKYKGDNTPDDFLQTYFISTYCKILYKCCVTLIDYSCNIVAFKFHVNITQLSHQSKHSNFSLYSDRVWYFHGSKDRQTSTLTSLASPIIWNNQKLQAIRNVCLPLKHPMKRGKHKHKD